MNKSKHLIVVSIDALVFEDLEYASTLPAFSEIMHDSAQIERVTTIYPSVTHPVHASILTGAPAGITGIVNNFRFYPEAPDRCEAWYNNLSDIRCDTLLHAAKRSGLSTAVSMWPLTCLGQDQIDYLIPDVMESDMLPGEDAYSAFKRLGAGDEVDDILREAIQKFGYDESHPAIDEFQIFCACRIIRKYKPNLLLTHPSYVDNQRHLSGVFTDKVKASIKATDKWLGDIVSALKESGIWESSDIVLLSDHGQINITRSVSPNVFLADAGFIKYDEKGKVTDWIAYAQSTGASAQVYLKDKTDKEAYSDVYNLLCDMAKEGIYGFEKVYRTDEVKEKYGLFGDFSFVLETDGYTSFGESPTRPAVRGYDFSDYRYGAGTHGQEPNKGPQPTFIGHGPSFKGGKVLPHGSILNHAPTLAKILGVTLADTKGDAINEILNID